MKTLQDTVDLLHRVFCSASYRLDPCFALDGRLSTAAFHRRICSPQYYHDSHPLLRIEPFQARGKLRTDRTHKTHFTPIRSQAHRLPLPVESSRIPNGCQVVTRDLPDAWLCL